MDRISLVIGRFQPFHRGHLAFILRCIAESDWTVVVVGSAQESGTSDNPFSSQERLRMIDAALRAERVENYSTGTVDDVHSDPLWVRNVEAAFEFNTIYSNNPHTLKLFGEEGYACVTYPLTDRDNLSGKEVRRRMAAGEDWRSLVPAAVAEVIDSVDGEKRVRSIRGGV